MKQLILTFSLLLFSIYSYSQEPNSTESEHTNIFLKNSTIINVDMIFSTDEYYYFNKVDDKEKLIYRIPTSEVDNCSDKKYIGNTIVGNEFIKFSKQAQRGMLISFLGTAGMIALPLAISSPYVFIPGGVIGIVGYFIWVNSYSHTKKIGIIMSAKDFPLTK